MKLAPNPRELAIHSGTTTADLQRTLAQWIGAASSEGSEPCPREAIHFLKPFGFQLKDPEALPMLWHTKAQPPTEQIVAAGVFNCKPGDLLLYKDSRIPEQVEPPAVHAGSGSEAERAAASARVEAPGFRILSPAEQIEQESKQAENRRTDGQDFVDIASRKAAVKAAGLGSGASIARTNSL